MMVGDSGHHVGPTGGKSMAELNRDRQQYEHKEVRAGVFGEGGGISEEDESRINESAVNVNVDPRRGPVSPLALREGLQKHQQQQLVGPIVRWERILPVRTLKVLLVEDDYSTRQVVSALLRNCSYEVTAVANGSQAWRILEDPMFHTDLVLTEVVMPGLSGIGLLCKIMSHNTRKNVSVIMMSSNDSLGTVFKCLSKGAVDFLVKPVRKNELKNLWQHVWRRTHSSSGSVSESDIQPQKSAKSQSADDSDNDSTSSEDDDNASIGFNARDGSDNDSGTQSSWTKHSVEVDGPQPMSPSDQLADPRDSTCAEVISESNILYNKWVPMTADRECQRRKKLIDECMGKDLEMGIPGNPDGYHESYPTENASIKLPATSMANQPDISQKNENVPGLGSSKAFDKPSTKAADLIGGIANNTNTQFMSGGILDSPNGFPSISGYKEKNDDGFVELPSLQLSLKRLRSTGEVTNDDRTFLRHSVQSAFSRYRTSAASAQALTGCGGSCSPIDNSLEAMKEKSTRNISNSNPPTAKQGFNGSSENIDAGSTTKNAVTNPATYNEKAAPTLVMKSIHLSAFHPVQLQTSNLPKVMQEKVNNITASTMVGQPIVVQHQIQPQHQQQPPKHDDSSHKNTEASAQLCGSSNVFAAPFERNAANYSINANNSESNHGSSPAVNDGAKMECVDGIADKCGIWGGSSSASGVDLNRFAQREAALNKFRLKRKERNFGKKVRYQSRKQLAEQRPRVRGQFVRQSVQENTSREANS